jgi:nicotinate phosphoribosyltransferase
MQSSDETNGGGSNGVSGSGSETRPLKRARDEQTGILVGGPANNLITPLLTDMYQISMAYGYWKAGIAENEAVFDLFFRKNPFKGEYCIFAGLKEVVQFVSAYRFAEDDIEYLRDILPRAEEGFFAYIKGLDCSSMKIYAMEEGTVVFPKEPLIRVEGPLIMGQLLETTLLNLINFPSLIATNAARMRLVAGADKKLLEFGLRRAQGPDGGFSASKYSFLGGFDGTSNVLAGKLSGIPVKGTHAHSFVMAYQGLAELKSTTLKTEKEGVEVEFVDLVLEKLDFLGWSNKTNLGELAAFISFAQAFPQMFLALVDTYDTLRSGVPNFLAVGAALTDLGYQPIGIRLDSGDLAYLSNETRKLFIDADQLFNKSIFENCDIVASNDINEEVLLHLSRGKHEINVFGIGTHLVTCQSQPALGCVYKLVSMKGTARIKLSEEVSKIVIPNRKNVYRLWGNRTYPLIDVMQSADDPPPQVGVPFFCRHPFSENKRATITPTRVESLIKLVWDGERGAVPTMIHTLSESRERCMKQLAVMREDHLRPLNPTPFKVSVSSAMYDLIHNMWMQEAPVAELS